VRLLDTSGEVYAGGTKEIQVRDHLIPVDIRFDKNIICRDVSIFHEVYIRGLNAVSIKWDFEDGIISVTNIVENGSTIDYEGIGHVYTSMGTFHVHVEISDASGIVAIGDTYIEVMNCNIPVNRHIRAYIIRPRPL
jgi:hypothetical protein